MAAVPDRKIEFPVSMRAPLVFLGLFALFVFLYIAKQ